MIDYNVIEDKEKGESKMTMKPYNEMKKEHIEKALHELLILEDILDYECNEISNAIDYLQDNLTIKEKENDTHL